MYAVIETGGKQYRVEVGTELEIELLDAGPGEAVAFERILLIADGDAASIGRPVVANASVSAEVLRRDRGEKLISFKYRPKARRRVKKGHRQELTVIRISDIVLDGKSAAADLAKVEEKRLTERQRLEEAARRQAEQDAALAAKLAADKPAKAATTKADTTKADTTKAATTKAAKAKAGKAAAPTKGKKSTTASTSRAARTGKTATRAAGSTAATSGTKAKPDTTDAGAKKGSSTTKATDASKASRSRKSDKD